MTTVLQAEEQPVLIRAAGLRDSGEERKRTDRWILKYLGNRQVT